MIKRILKSLFTSLGIEVRRIPQKKMTSSPDSVLELSKMESALRRIKLLNIEPDCIIDVGAAKGLWSQKALDVWNQPRFILIEPLREQIDKMGKHFTESPMAEVYEAVAGKEEGTVTFNVSTDFDGSGIYGREDKNARRVKVVALDSVCQGRFNSILLKLDTHGYEIPIFEGAAEVLKKTAAIIVEVYGFHVSPTGKLFHEISTYLAEKGFRLFDVVDTMRRPADKAFWQADAVYLRADNKVFSNNSYQ